VSTLYSIGHSTRPIEEFITLLSSNGVRKLADVRTIPKSRRHPQFNGDVLDASLRAQGIDYRHFPALGGLRKPRRDSPNTAWRNTSFRGYADHMQTPAFATALDDLLVWATMPAAIMCAEAVWWQCHRQLIADALVARGCDVAHILSSARPGAHTLTAFAQVREGAVTYPGLI
jgi:uncharacterized protein (DUF488 family)